MQSSVIRGVGFRKSSNLFNAVNERPPGPKESFSEYYLELDLVGRNIHLSEMIILYVLQGFEISDFQNSNFLQEKRFTIRMDLCITTWKRLREFNT